MFVPNYILIIAEIAIAFGVAFFWLFTFALCKAAGKPMPSPPERRREG